MSLWTHGTVVAATASVAQGAFEAARVEIDSRKIQRGDLFVALKGERFDAHDFVAQALASGAAAAIVERPVEGAHVVVPDALKALEGLGVYNRARSQAQVVGVTGSVGKTSTKEMLKLALGAYATSGNYNNHIGTPLNLANLPPDARFAVFEMGMNHAGEIAHLTRMVRPHVVVISNVEAVHLEFFASTEAIADAKAEIFEGLEGAGVAVLNADQPYLAQLAAKAAGAKIITFGADAKSDCRLLAYAPTRGGCTVKADICGQAVEYTLGAIGRHWAVISLSVLAVAHALSLDIREVAARLADFSEVEGRGRVAQVGGVVFVNDSYNASPAAMRAAFAKTAEVWEAHGKKGRKVALLGDMLELGDAASVLHAQLAEPLVESGFDAVYTAGNLARHLHEALPAGMRAGHADNAMELLKTLALAKDDVVLIKGSHGSKMYELADALLGKEGKKHAV